MIKKIKKKFQKLQLKKKKMNKLLIKQKLIK